MVELERAVPVVDVPEEISESLAEVANKAAKLFSYHRAGTYVTGASTRRQNAIAINKVGVILEGLGIVPFEPSIVKKYKDRMHSSQRGPRRKEWMVVGINNYDEMVPAFVLARAVEAFEALKAAGFTPKIYVEHFSERQNAPDTDPFLILGVVECGQHAFYLDVWDEPEFEGRKKA